jgi:hypothetical protein
VAADNNGKVFLAFRHCDCTFGSLSLRRVGRGQQKMHPRSVYDLVFFHVHSRSMKPEILI